MATAGLSCLEADAGCQRRVGGVGWFTDHIEEQIVVTVDPSEASRPNELIEQIEASAGGIVDVVIRPACYPREELEEAATAISRRDWHPDPRLQVWEISAIGRVLVGLCEPAEEQARILTEEHGHRVDIRLVECGSVGSATTDSQGRSGGEPQTTPTTALEASVSDSALQSPPRSEAASGSEEGGAGAVDEAGSESDVGGSVPSWVASVGLIVAGAVGVGLVVGSIRGRSR